MTYRVPPERRADWLAKIAASQSKTHAAAKAGSAANIKRWRDGGGMEGELARRAADPNRPRATTEFMPFPGHKHMGEAG